jgi:hypothetical protein
MTPLFTQTAKRLLLLCGFLTSFCWASVFTCNHFGIRDYSSTIRWNLSECSNSIVFGLDRGRLTLDLRVSKSTALNQVTFDSIRRRGRRMSDGDIVDWTLDSPFQLQLPGIQLGCRRGYALWHTGFNVSTDRHEVEVRLHFLACILLLALPCSIALGLRRFQKRKRRTIGFSPNVLGHSKGD